MQSENTEKTNIPAADTPEETLPVRSKGSLRPLFRYWTVFFLAITYWEIFMGRLSQGSFSSINFWFLLFAVPQALVFAALCGWGGDRLNRVVSAVLLFALFAFYTAQFIFFRAFDSVISLSMIGMGGDAMDDFGWAMMVTIKESWLLLLLLSLPVLLALARIFSKKPSAGKIKLLFRPVALAAAVLLWLAAGQALRLGGTNDSSAWRAYVSSLVDADTSSKRIGVLTTTVMDLRSSLAEEEYDKEISDTVGSAVSSESIEIPVGAQVPVLPAELPAVPAETEAAASVEEPEVPEEDPVDRSPNIFEDIDFNYLASITDKESLKSLCEYLATVPGTNRNEYTGLLEGYNVIFVCAESFCSYAMNEQVTPTLWKMANEGIVLTNFYNSFKNTTTNGEFAFMTGLWPDVSRKADKGVTTGSFGQSVKNFMPCSLGNIFSQFGVRSFAFHNYLGRYYGRDKTHANLGYKCKFMGEMKFTNKWPSSDYEMMLQSVDDFIEEDRFNVYYMTFSGHGPYRTDNNAISRANAPKVPKSLNGRKLEPVARCYIANNLEVERSMQYLLRRLEEAGKYDNTLIVLMGDHYPYYLHDQAVKSILGKLPEKNFERYHSTCIMWFAGKEPIVCDTPCCNVDILPTVLNLLGIPYDSRLYSGTDIFSDSLHAAMLYNKNFITESVKYNASDGKATWLIDTGDLDKDQMQAYVDNVYSVLKARYAAALSINKVDFYRFVWENSGLMPSEEEEPVSSEAAADESALPEADPSAGTVPEATIPPGLSLEHEEKRIVLEP